MYHVELLFHFDKKGVGGGGQGVVGFIFDLDVGAAMMWLGGGGGGEKIDNHRHVGYFKSFIESTQVFLFLDNRPLTHMFSLHPLFFPPLYFYSSLIIYLYALVGGTCRRSRCRTKNDYQVSSIT